MKLTPKKLWNCIKCASYDTVIRHDGIEHAGYLAFLGLLALFPFLVFIFSVIGVIGQGASGAAFINSVLHSLPADITSALRPRIEEIVSGPPQGLLTVSILGAIWTASSAVEGLRTVLNRAHRVATPPAYLFRRSLSIVQLLFFSFILIASMLIVIAAPLLFERLETQIGFRFIEQSPETISLIVFLATIFMLFVAISYIYYILPNIRQRFLLVAPGAALVVVLWIAAAQLLTLYLSHFNQVNLIYGGLGGIIAALVFFYICNVIFIFGAELNHQLMVALGLHMEERQTTETLPAPTPQSPA